MRCHLSKWRTLQGLFLLLHLSCWISTSGELHEFDEDDQQADEERAANGTSDDAVGNEGGESRTVLEKFIDKYSEPYGVVVIAYVDHYSPNHQLMKKLGEALDDEKDKEGENASLHTLGVHMAAAVQWREPGNESLELVYRTPFAALYQSTLGGNTPMKVPDTAKPVFPSKPGAAWKEKAVRKWLLHNAYPLINIRIMDEAYGPFPEAKYMSPLANQMGVVVLACDLTGDLEFKAQYQLSKVLVPYAEKYRSKLKFTFVEKGKKTKDFRLKFGVGMKPSKHVDGRAWTPFTCQMLLADNVKDFWPEKKDGFNHYNGNPNKYFLEDADPRSVPKFFEAYEKKQLPKYWVSRELWTWDTGVRPKDLAKRISGPEFEQLVYESDPKMMKLVLFSNDDPADDCKDCVAGRKVWEATAKIILRKKELSSRVELLAIDQSANEHPESLIPGKIAQPLIVYYPPGKAKARKTKRRKLDKFTEKLPMDSAEALVELIEDLIMDEADDGTHEEL